MIAEQIMQKNLFTLLPTNTIVDAANLMYEQKIRHIPIVNEQFELVGIVSDQDIKEAMPSSIVNTDQSILAETEIAQIMSTEPFYAHPLDFVEDIALNLYESKKSCMPIVSSGKLVGIVTTTDLLHTYMELTGATTPGSKIDIRVKNGPHVLYEITDLFKKHNVFVISVLVYADQKDANYSIVSVRVRILNPISLIEALRQEGFDVLWPNMPGMIV